MACVTTELEVPSNRWSWSGGIEKVDSPCFLMNNVSTNESEDPESMRAENFKEEKDSKRRDGDRETEVPEGETEFEPGAYSLEESENIDTGKETVRKKEFGSDKPDAFKRKTCPAREGSTRPSGRA